ncbi:MAG TPA: serine peptidase, partial [Noviherbaspirillum sp.]|nr:serine peptidase [Noviherbaspirillum sp.]
MKAIQLLRNAFFAVLFGSAVALLAPAGGGVIASAHAQQGQILPDFADLAERTGPAVVNIRTTQRM